MARLIIPDDFTSQLTLLNNIIAQNTALGASSPLTAFLTQQNIVLTNDEATGAAAQTHDVSRALLKKQSENYRQLRDHYFSTPWAHLTGGVQFLIYSNGKRLNSEKALKNSENYQENSEKIE